ADDKQEFRQGGFAGWLTDGTPLWVTGSGTSKTVLTRYATVLNRVLLVPTQVASGQCVEVELFIIGKPAPGFHPYPTTEHGCDTDFRLVQHHI
ncbi:hypothetical protein, partial [Vibrio cholerae]|uniref:hypothetical protein n=1 Tax=Vibrio cholerae TaxID=666 RepID=UPI003075D427